MYCYIWKGNYTSSETGTTHQTWYLSFRAWTKCPEQIPTVMCVRPVPKPKDPRWWSRIAWWSSLNLDNRWHSGDGKLAYTAPGLLYSIDVMFLLGRWGCGSAEYPTTRASGPTGLQRVWRSSCLFDGACFLFFIPMQGECLAHAGEL